VEAADLELALEATRLLGRWSMISQRHGGGCSCCPGLGDVDMADVERSVLEGLRRRHAVLKDRESLAALLRDCVARKGAEKPESLRALFADVGMVIEDLERIQSGLW
jgi:hypothetical protein